MKHVISTEAHAVCEVEKSAAKSTDVSTEFILSVVEGLDMTTPLHALLLTLNASREIKK